MNDFIQPIIEDNKKIFFIKGDNEGKYPYSHSLLIEDLLIDTGISSRLLRKLIRLYHINKVLLSHWHEDHISGNRLLPKAEFYIHSKDKVLIENINKFNEYYGILNTPSEEEFNWFYEGLKLEDTKITQELENNDQIKIGNEFNLRVIHTPGHTAGHCAFLELCTKTAFLADIDLTNFVFYAGLDSNLIDFEASLDKLNTLDIKTAITGHRGIIEGQKTIKEELNKYKAIIYKRDERILSNFSETNPKKLIEFKKKNFIYKYYGLFKEYEIIAEMIMIQKHIDKFLKSKVIELTENGYILS